MRKNALLVLLALFFPIALFAAGCGDDDDSGDDDTEQTDSSDDSSDESTDDSEDSSSGDAPDNEEEAVELMAESLSASGDLSEDDAECMAQYIVDEIGFDNLVEAGFNEENAADAPPAELQDDIQNAALGAFEECDVTIPTG